MNRSGPATGRRADRWRIQTLPDVPHNLESTGETRTRFKFTLTNAQLAQLERLASREAVSSAEWLRRRIAEAAANLPTQK